MKKLNELIRMEDGELNYKRSSFKRLKNLFGFQNVERNTSRISAMLDDISEAALIANRLVLVNRLMKTKLTDEERKFLGTMAEKYPVYILRSMNGDDYFLLSEFDGEKELQPFANGEEKYIFNIIAGL